MNSLKKNEIEEMNDFPIITEEKNDFEINCEDIEDNSKIEEMCDYVLTNLEFYKEMDKKMKLYNDEIKKYMEKNNKISLKTKKGVFTLIKQSRKFLDRTLIQDIEKYYKNMKVSLLYKTKNS